MNRTTKKFFKDPNEAFDYAIHWHQVLADGEEISSSVWEISDNTLTLSQDQFSITKTNIWVADGDIGTVYKLTNRITTTQNRTFEDSIFVHIIDR